MRAKFFELFQVLYSVGKKAYQLELIRKWRFYDVLHMSLFEQVTTRKERIDDNATLLNIRNSKEYKMKAI